MKDLASFTYKKLAEKQAIKSKEELEKVNINIRIWLSSGKGDFGIYSHVHFLFLKMKGAL